MKLSPRVAWSYPRDAFLDARHALPALRRRPVLGVVIILSLACGIGAVSALAAFVNGTLLRDLDVAEPQELVQLHWESREWFPDMRRFAGTGSVSAQGRRSPTFSTPLFEALQRQAVSQADLFAFTELTPVGAVIDGQGLGARMQLVSPNYFAVLRLEPLIGRLLGARDDDAASERAVILSERFWRLRTGGDPNIVGRSVLLDGVGFRIVGVAPAQFRGIAALGRPGPDMWATLAAAPSFRWFAQGADRWWLSIAGRLRTGLTAEHAHGVLSASFASALFGSEVLDPSDQPQLKVRSARRGARQEGPDDEIEHTVRLGLIFSFLLVLVCLNVSSLLLSSTRARRSELSVRLALGATGGRLVRQLVAESLMLAIIGGFAGLLLAYWGTPLFALAAIVPPGADINPDPLVAVVTLCVSILAGGLMAWGPAVQLAARPAKRRSLVTGLRASRAGDGGALLAIQAAATVVLLIGSSLLARSLGNWDDINPGFDTSNLSTFRIEPDALGYDVAASTTLVDTLVARLRTVPGVSAVTASAPLGDGGWPGRIVVDGRSRQDIAPQWLPVRHDFFETLRMPLVAGRTFRPGEGRGQITTAVIDARLAESLFPGAPAIGRHLSFSDGGPQVEIVGVVGAMWLPGTRPENIRPTIYFPETARPVDFDPGNTEGRGLYRRAYPIGITFRSAGDPVSTWAAIRAAAADVDRAVPILDLKTVEQALAERLDPTRTVALLWGVFTSVSVLLMALGMYGQISYSVTSRVRELGIRIALGASRMSIYGAVAGRTARRTFIGAGCGLVATFGFVELIDTFLFGVSTYDPIHVLAAVGILILVMVSALVIAARRAVRMEPSEALRVD